MFYSQWLLHYHKCFLEGNQMKNVLKSAPAVFAVGDNYQIIVPVASETVMWVKIGDKCFYDESNGILRSAKKIHKMFVPAEILNKEGSYTICYRRVKKRKAYFSKTHSVEEVSFNFKRVQGKTVRAYHISDAHNMIKEPVKCAEKFREEIGEIDFLILNGDVPEDSDNIKNFDTIYEIVSQITKGEIPVIFSRGNHDTRGIFAENIEEYTPCENGNSYFHFRLGNIWGLVLDCGEDKPDTNEEYGNMVACSFFREKQTQFLVSLAENGMIQFDGEGVEHKIVIAHNPFTRRYKPPFNIEEDTFTYWSKILKEKIKPDVMICGHIHKFSVDMPGCENDAFGQPCPVVVGSQVNKDEKYFAGSGFVFGKNGIEIIFNDENKILEKHILNA